MGFMVDRMRAWSFPGGYEDDRGAEPVEWRIEPDEVSDSRELFDLEAVIRGVRVRGDLEDLTPYSADTHAREIFSLDGRSGNLARYTVTGELPCTVEVSGVRRVEVIRFTYAQHPYPEHDMMHLALSLDGEEYETDCDALETGLPRLADALPAGVSLKCCFTCLYSDYMPSSGQAMGIACFRDDKERYLAIRSKFDIWRLRRTEWVPETYLCSEYQRRVRGTGYRG
ncbi:hypothetical protein FG87_25070 [Nocardia vulneris]|uniref:Glycolipid-binding domain-containing protein n=2 Tax=Nocardia vulneris TaxID=1141657 RepID=A0ABR4ZBD8_9NOCA|nr:hypothetical protein FG87_25070 [Nocardia vulneris]